MVEQLIPNQQAMGSNPVYPATKKEVKMEKFISYVKLSKLELTKVIFPLKEQVKNAYLSVFLVVTVITLFLALIDSIMSFSLSGLLD